MCPVLLQDKYRYLKLLREMVNNTLRVLLVEEGKFNAAELEQITSFMERNASDSRQEVRTASSFLLSLTTSIVCSSTFSLSLSLSLSHTHMSHPLKGYASRRYYRKRAAHNRAKVHSFFHNDSESSE